jgi:hypothetical protein
MSINRLVDNIENRLYSDGKVDDSTIIQITDTIQKVSSVAIGVLAWIILILLPIIIAIEIVYICFPFIREKTNEMILKLEQRGHKHNLPGFVLRDAIKANEEAEKMMANGTGDLTGTGSALWIYIKLKLPAIFFAFFVLAFVLAGTSTIVQIISNLVHGIIGHLL